MIKLLLATLAFFTLAFSAFSQQGDSNGSKRYIKIVIDSDVSNDTEIAIGEAFAHTPGVQVSRMDNVNRTYLAIYTPGTTLSQETFMNWFTNNGYTINCFYDNVYEVGKMIDISKNNCH
jgi:hypothetical protein